MTSSLLKEVREGKAPGHSRGDLVRERSKCKYSRNGLCAKEDVVRCADEAGRVVPKQRCEKRHSVIKKEKERKKQVLASNQDRGCVW